METLLSALLTLGLVAVAVVLSPYGRLNLEKDIGAVVVRSFVQLAATGYAINYIFALESLPAVTFLLAGMAGFVTWTSAAGRRACPARFRWQPGRSGLQS